MNSSVEPSPPPTPLSLDICANVDCKPIGCHLDLFSQPSSSRSVDPPHFGVLCSSIPDSACDVHKDQVGEGVVFSNQPALSFFMSMCGNLKKNLR